MDKTTFDLLTELIILMDTRIAEQRQIHIGAARSLRADLAHHSNGKIAGYQLVAAWARAKMKADADADRIFAGTRVK